MARTEVSPEVPNTPAATTRPDGVEITPADMEEALARRGQTEEPASLPPLTIDAVNYAKANFDRMDGDRDGFVSEEELDGYIKANKKFFKAGEQEIVDGLKAHMSDLEEASNDETWDEDNGFTRKDLADVETDATAATTGPKEYDLNGGDLRPALDYANKNFKKLDADGDGFIHSTEIDKYIEDNDLPQEEVGLLRNLKQNAISVFNAHDDGEWFIKNGISAKDLETANDNINNLAFAVENFSELDGDGNGFISSAEITGYERARNNLTRAETKALDYLRNNVGDLEELSNDETGDENNGVTGYDLLKAMEERGSANARGQRKLGVPSTEIAAVTPPTTDVPPTTDGPTPPDTTETGPQERTHTVARGETLWQICAEELRSRNGGTRPSNMDVLNAIRAVENANPTLDRERIKPGQEIKIPKDLNCPTEPGESGPRRPVPRPVPVPVPREPRDPAPPTYPIPRPPRDPEVPTPPRQPEPPRTEVKPEPEKSDPDVLREHWRAIDRTGDNRVSREEIQDFVRNNQRNLTMKEITALGRMAAREGKIQELVNDERGDENSGMSQADLQKAEQLQAAAQYLLRKDVMDRLNLNGDRFVDRRELEFGLRTQNMRPQDRAMLNFLRSNYAKFQEGANNERGDENSGVSIQDLQYYAGLV